MASSIDPTKPVEGPLATTSSVRDNFSAAKTEIEALQAGTIPGLQDTSTFVPGSGQGFELVYSPPLNTETAGNIECHEYPYDNVLRWIPRTLHSALRAGTNTTDLQTYITNAITDIIKGGTNKVNAGRLFFPFMPAGYRLESSLVISDSRGIALVFENAQTLSAESDTGSNCQLQWYGNATTSVIYLHTLCYATHIINPSINCKASTNKALCGIQIGADTGATAARDITIENPVIQYGRFGVAVTFADNTSVDAAPVKIKGGLIRYNDDAGILVAGVNCVVDTDGVFYGHNGASPTTDTYNPSGIGANTFLSSGQLSETFRTSVGKGATQPNDADIYQGNGSYSVDVAWSDTHGYFFYEVNSLDSGSAPRLSKVRHYESTMNGTNTPTSIRFRSPGATISDSLVFADIEGVSGLSGYVIASGVNFHSGGTGDFTGDLFTTQKGLIRIGNKGNIGQIAMGGGGTRNFDQTTSDSPAFVINGSALTEVRGPDTGDSGYVIGHPSPTNGSFVMSVNCYPTDSTFTNFKAYTTGEAMVLHLQNNRIRCRFYNFPDTTNNVAFASFDENFQVDTNATAGNTRLQIWDVDSGTLERVSVGAADSGGTGYKVLRIPN